MYCAGYCWQYGGRTTKRSVYVLLSSFFFAGYFFTPDLVERVLSPRTSFGEKLV